MTGSRIDWKSSLTPIRAPNEYDLNTCESVLLVSNYVHIISFPSLSRRGGVCLRSSSSKDLNTLSLCHQRQGDGEYPRECRYDSESGSHILDEGENDNGSNRN